MYKIYIKDFRTDQPSALKTSGAESIKSSTILMNSLLLSTPSPAEAQNHHFKHKNASF